MTDRDKAIDALECLSDLIKLAKKDQKTAADYELIRDRSDCIRQALIPQSSADMGKVLRERVEEMRKRTGLDATTYRRLLVEEHNAAIDSVQRILDEVIGRAE